MQGIKEWPCGFVEKHGLLPPIIFQSVADWSPPSFRTDPYMYIWVCLKIVYP